MKCPKCGYTDDIKEEEKPHVPKKYGDGLCRKHNVFTYKGKYQTVNGKKVWTCELCRGEELIPESKQY